MRSRLPVELLGLLLVWSNSVDAFTVARLLRESASSFSSLQLATMGTGTASSSVEKLQQQIDACIARNDNPEGLLKQLEAIPSTKEPNRSPSFLGEWHVWYTDCPPPSNGQLGPFQGTAEQVIEGATTRSYQNLLRVPPNDWLTATLDGVWEEWDGKLLDDGSKKVDIKSSNSVDYGSTCWKVTFLQLQIAFLGLPLFTKKFEDTSRVWRTTYLDDEIRIVRAGKTGRRSDEVVFYTKRTPAPSP